VAAGWELDPREVELLSHACRTADLIDQLEVSLAADGLLTVGSQGQTRLNQAVAEIRQQRLAMSRLLDLLNLPDVDHPRISRNQQRKATKRWAG
jgi:hypothetical protein